MQNLNSGIAEMSIISEKPLFPKTSVLQYILRQMSPHARQKEQFTLHSSRELAECSNLHYKKYY